MSSSSGAYRNKNTRAVHAPQSHCTSAIPAGKRMRLRGEEAAMTSCPECESDIDIDVEEVEEGDVVACAECGTEYEIVGVEPLELSKVEEGIDEDEDDFKDEDEEEE